MHFSKTEKYTLHVLGVVSRPASKNTWIPQGHRSAFPPATPRRSLGAPDNAPLFFAFLRDARNTRLSVLSLPLHLTNPIYELHDHQVHLGCSWITLAACKSACMMYAQRRLGRRANTDHPPAKKKLAWPLWSHSSAGAGVGEWRSGLGGVLCGRPRARQLRQADLEASFPKLLEYNHRMIVSNGFHACSTATGSIQAPASRAP